MKNKCFQFGIILVFFLFMFISCEMNVEHVHIFSEEWTWDETNHWHVATCGHEEVSDKAEHSFGNWEIITEATEEAEGLRERSCTVCGYKEVSDKVEHSFGEWEEKDSLTLIRSCTKCKYSEEKLNIETLKGAGLPIVEINTVGNAAITSKEDWLDATLNLTGNHCNEEDLFVATEIKGRGNSSWNQPKKSYSLKLESKEKVLGMKKHKRWVLIANYSDKTLLRNYLASELGNNYFNSVWNPSFKPVHLILNGTYNGVYLVGEQIKIDGNRVNIQAIDEIEEDINGDDIVNLDDGGFICEVNERMDELFNFTTTKGIKISLKEPDEVSTDIQEKIVSIVQKAEDALYGENWLDSEIGYSKYFDINSFVDWYIVNELTKNNDACFFSSVYFYYDPNDKLIHMGPNWDFDISCGNINYNGCDNPEGYWIKNSGWIKRMFEDTDFVNKVEERWTEKRKELSDYITTSIQENANYLAAAADLNFAKWDILGSYVWPNSDGYEERTTYQSEVDYLIDWLNKRFEFLDKDFNK